MERSLNKWCSVFLVDFLKWKDSGYLNDCVMQLSGRVPLKSFFFNFFDMDWILRAWGQATRKSLLCWKTIWRRTEKDECLEWTCFSVIQPENWTHGSIPGGSRGFILRNKILTLPFISFCVDPMQTGDKVWHSQDWHKSSSQHWNLNTSVRCTGRSLPQQPVSVRETLF